MAGKAEAFGTKKPGAGERNGLKRLRHSLWEGGALQCSWKINQIELMSLCYLGSEGYSSTRAMVLLDQLQIHLVGDMN